MNIEEAMKIQALTSFQVGMMRKEELQKGHEEDRNHLVLRFDATLKVIKADWEADTMHHLTMILGREPVLKKTINSKTGQEFTYMI